jgi:hypothetical protein
MSTPIQQAELSPDDPKFYAPPKWRSGEINAPSIQPSLKFEFPASPAAPGWTAPSESAREDNAAPDGQEQAPDVAHQLEYDRVRVTAIASAVGVVAWTAFCITIGLERLDKINFSQLRSAPTVASEPQSSLDERLQAAKAALQKEWRQTLAPTLVVADSTGVVNAALPLSIQVSNYTPDAKINLSGLLPGTMLSSGARSEQGQWRVSVDDLPKTHVIPPPEYIGPMTIVAELRNGDDQAIVRTPLRLTWRPATTEPIGFSVSPPPPALPALLPAVAEKQVPKQALFEQFLAWQNDSASETAAPSPRRHKVSKRHRHRNQSMTTEAQAGSDPRGQQRRTAYTLSSDASVSRDQWPLWMGNRQASNWQDIDDTQTGSSKRGGKRSQSSWR